MADIPPNVPGGAMPPKPAEASKVQPKKETVRITLPPKPTAAPTVKLPSLAPAAITAAPLAAAPAAPAGTSLASRPAAAPSTASGIAAKGAAPGRTPAPPYRPAPSAAKPSALDSVLAIAVGIVAIAGAGILFFLYYSVAVLEY